MYTSFYDMSSGGTQKEKWKTIYIEGDEDAATRMFEDIFCKNPNEAECLCCGENYYIKEEESNGIDEILKMELKSSHGLKLRSMIIFNKEKDTIFKRD